MNIPVIGQPRIVDWGVNLVVKCPAPCDGTVLMSGKHGAQVLCNSCRRVYVIGALQFTNNELQVGLGVGMMPAVTT